MNKSEQIEQLNDKVESLEGLFAKVSKLEDEVLKKEDVPNSFEDNCIKWWGFDSSRKFSLRGMAEDDREKIDKIDDKLQAILDHLGQEYVEVIEKNGDTKTFHKLRKKGKK